MFKGTFPALGHYSQEATEGNLMLDTLIEHLFPDCHFTILNCPLCIKF